MSECCDQPTVLEVNGHNTHKPPRGRFCPFVTEEDAKGESRPQYFVPTNRPNTITEAEKQQYSKNIKSDKTTEAYIKKHNDKYE